MLTISVGQKSFTLSDEEEKALLYDMVDVFLWVKNLVESKVRRVVDAIVAEHTEYNPQKLTYEEKIKIVAGLELKTAAERNKGLEEGRL